ncbi:MAG: SMP-30/gluconolactonase/LRE family protein [Actinomycetota bacterium]
MPARAGFETTGAVKHPPRVVTTFATDTEFAESMVVDSQGDIFASVTHWGKKHDSGQIWKVSPDGHKIQFGPRIDAGQGVLTGMAFDVAGNLYVAVATFSDAPRPRILRIAPDGSSVLVASLPAASFPNGLAVHEEALYVTDSALGVVWKVQLADASVTRWLEDPMLLPGTKHGIGANGIAFRLDQLYVAVSDPGVIVQVPLQPDGTPGNPTVFSRKHALATADGIAFDVRGRMWVAANENRLLRLSPTGSLFRFADGSTWLNYPTAMAFGPQRQGTMTLYIENGAFQGGTPNILAMKVRA